MLRIKLGLEIRSESNDTDYLFYVRYMYSDFEILISWGYQCSSAIKVRVLIVAEVGKSA